MIYLILISNVTNFLYKKSNYSFIYSYLTMHNTQVVVAATHADAKFNSLTKPFKNANLSNRSYNTEQKGE